MKKSMILVLCCLLMIACCAVASACGPYVLFPDSNVRVLSQREVQAYSYDALGYALNEIFARYGFHFDHDGKYYEHFTQIAEYDPATGRETYFYTEAPSSVSNQDIYDRLSNTEWKNVQLIKQVRQSKRDRGEYTGPDYSVWMCDEGY